MKRRAIDDKGRPKGVPSNNPILDTRQYKAEFLDSTIEVLTANVIAENLLAQVDENRHCYLLLDKITNHRTSRDAITKEEGTYTTKSGLKKGIRRMKGWELHVRWKDGSTDWITLKDLKESYPVPLTDYAIANDIQDEPAFAWWVPYVERKKNRILSKVKSKYWQRTHKYGIRIPKSVEEAYCIDKENGNRLWTDAISEEIVKVRGAVEECTKSPDKLVGYQEIDLHMIFDIKLGENFRRKARMVVGGHMTKPPSSVTYSSVVSRESVRIMLMVAALNDLEIQSADIKNAYLTAPCRERV